MARRKGPKGIVGRVVPEKGIVTWRTVCTYIDCPYVQGRPKDQIETDGEAFIIGAGITHFAKEQTQEQLFKHGENMAKRQEAEQGNGCRYCKEG